MNSLLLLLVAALLLNADDKAKAPAMPLSVEAEYYRADAAVARLQASWESANTDLQKAVADLQKACGDKFVPYASGKHLVCVPKPDKTPKGAAPAPSPK